MQNKLPVLVVLLFCIAGVVSWLKFSDKVPESDFMAPGKNWQSPKKVEDYFVEKLRFSEKDLERQKTATKVSFRPSKESTLEAVIGNLRYYGFIRSENALRYALEHTEDKTEGNDGALMVGKNGSIDITASYDISENMTAWEMADTLLNKSHYFGPGDEYGYMFMP